MIAGQKTLADLAGTGQAQLKQKFSGNEQNQLAWLQQMNAIARRKGGEGYIPSLTGKGYRQFARGNLGNQSLMDYAQSLGMENLYEDSDWGSNLNRSYDFINKYNLNPYSNLSDTEVGGFTMPKINQALNFIASGKTPGARQGVLPRLAYFDSLAQNGGITKEQMNLGGGFKLTGTKNPNTFMYRQEGVNDGNVGINSIRFNMNEDGTYTPMGARFYHFDDPPEKKGGLLGGLGTLASAVGWMTGQPWLQYAGTGMSVADKLGKPQKTLSDLNDYQG